MMGESIAIISSSCRFPGANNPEEFWEILVGGVDATSEVPPERPFAAEISAKHIKRGGFLKCAVDSFDAAFFNITADKAPFLDPQQRLLLEVTWECLERAAINPDTLKGGDSTGVFIGIWSNDYRDILHKSTAAFKSCEYHVAYLSFALGVTAARISHFLGLRGPHGSVDAGCSSSLYSVHQAVTSLRQGECSLAVAGGVNLILHPAIGKLNSLVLAPDGRCKSFDAKANGFGRAEGCGVILLKRLSDALKDGNHILGVIRGVSVNSDATFATFGTPSRVAQAKTIERALMESGLGPEAISYVEAHGTGTEVGDTVEISAIGSIYSTKKRQSDCPLVISSAKPNIGHCEAAAGIASIIKVLLALKHGIIPPHINFTTPHQCIDLKSIPAIIPTMSQKWSEPGRIAGISTFGLGGHNAHLILQEPPRNIEEKSENCPMERPVHILTLSAKCDGALNQLITDYAAYLKEETVQGIGNIAYTANTGRAHLPHRMAVIGKSTKDISSKLEEKKFIKTVCKNQNKNERDPKIAFLFGDHSSNYAGTCRALYESNAIFKESIDECSFHAGMSISERLFGKEEGEEPTELPVIFSVQYALSNLWISFGIRPQAVLGYGIGELSASVVSGRSPLGETMRLVLEYAKAMEKLPEATFLAVSAPKIIVEDLMQKFLSNNRNTFRLDVAAVNAPEEVVVVGDVDTVNAFADFCENYQRGCDTRWVSDYKAIHSKMAAEIFHRENNNNNNIKKTTTGINGKNENCEFVSCVADGENVLASCVNFSDNFPRLWSAGCRVFLEIGTNPVLLGLAMSNFGQNEASEAIWLPSLRKYEDSWTTLLTSLVKLYLHGVAVDWKGYDDKYDRKRISELPTYPFQRKRFWVDQ